MLIKFLQQLYCLQNNLAAQGQSTVAEAGMFGKYTAASKGLEELCSFGQDAKDLLVTK